MDLVNFKAFTIICSIFWITGLCFILFPSKLKIYKIAGKLLIPFGIIALLVLIIDFCSTLSQAPFRTLGEIRLYYAFFIAIITYIIFIKWHFKWFLAFGLSLSIMFLMLNFFKSENFNLMIRPDLQSPWFIARVTVYIFSYAMLGAATLVAIKGIINLNKKRFNASSLIIADNLVYIGFGFLSIGLIFGILWTKQAWGHYRTWEAQETWSFLSWILYLLFIHFRNKNPKKTKTAILFLLAIMAILIISWFGMRILLTSPESIFLYSI